MKTSFNTRSRREETGVCDFRDEGKEAEDRSLSLHFGRSHPEDIVSSSLPPWAQERPFPDADPEAIYEAGLKNHHIANTAYPIAHRQTIWDYRVKPDVHEKLLATSFAAMDEMCLYAHIPFCESRCVFCEYTVVKDHNEELESRYHHALLQELRHYVKILGMRKTLLGFDLGGGTPALIRPERIGELVAEVRRSFVVGDGFGVSIETTPKIAALHPEKIKAYRQFGIDRISMGLQMVSPRLLREYGRDLNGVGYNLRAVESIREAGFKRFNIDLMYGLAKQTVGDFCRSLEYTIRLNPEYITLYRMRYKGTRIQEEASAVDLRTIQFMQKKAHELLKGAGYGVDPGKNGFSRVPGDHGTSPYLTRRVVWSTPYLGIGLGAQTFTNNLLAYNQGAANKVLRPYLDSISKGILPIQDLYHLPLEEGMAKMISVSFYFGRINLDAFRIRFGMSLEERFSREVKFVLERGFMELRGSTLRLTDLGASAFNGVIALFYSNSVKAYLLDL